MQSLLRSILPGEDRLYLGFDHTVVNRCQYVLYAILTLIFNVVTPLSLLIVTGVCAVVCVSSGNVEVYEMYERITQEVLG